MRLHCIRAVNLNSLYGEQIVDIDGDLAGPPLFLIQGPTGSGKSTVMDAISLALFGQTPRLTNERGKDDANAGLVMSWGTGECLAEVDFSRLEADGQRRRYRARWACHRARKRPEGALQAPERSLEVRKPDGHWQLIYSGKKVQEAAQAFNRVLEDFGVRDFQRSMLLAQGQFDALLSAEPAERAAILERLTRTTEYQEIGARAARLSAAYRERITALEASWQQFGVIDPAELVAKSEAEVEGRKKRDKKRAELESLQAARRWLEEHRRAGEEVEKARAVGAEVEKEREAAQQDLSRLAEHERCRAGFIALDEVRADEEAILSCEKDIVGLGASLLSHEAELRRAEETRTAVRTRRDEAWRLVIELKAEAVAMQAALDARTLAAKEESGAANVATEARQAFEEAGKVEGKTEGAFATRCEELRQAEGAHKSRQHLAVLAAGWEELRARLDDVIRREADVEAETKRLCDEGHHVKRAGAKLGRDREALVLFETERVVPARRALEDARAALNEALGAKPFVEVIEKLREDEARIAVRIEALKAVEGALLQVRKTQAERGRRARMKDGASQALDEARADEEERGLVVKRREETAGAAREAYDRLMRVAAVAEHRVDLSPGQPCPLCGALEHPSIDEHAIDDDGIALEVKASKKELAGLEARVKKARRAATTAHAGRKAVEERLAIAERELQEAGDSATEMALQLQSAMAGTDLPGDCDDRACREAIEKESTSRREARVQLEGLETARRLVGERREVAEGQEKALGLQVQLLEKQDVEIRAKLDELDAARLRQTAKQENIAEAVEGVRRDLVAYSIEFPTEAPDEWRRIAAAAVEEWKELVAVVEAAKRAVQLAQQQLDAARKTGEERRLSLAAATTEREQRRVVLEEKTGEAEGARVTLLDLWQRVLATDRPEDDRFRPTEGAPPGDLERSQLKAAEVLDNQLRLVSAAADSSLEAVGETRGRITQLQAVGKKLRSSFEVHTGSFAETTRGLGVPDVADLEKRRLSLERCDELGARRRELERMERDAAARLKERKHIRAEILVRRPSDLEETTTIEELGQAIDAAKQAVAEVEVALEEVHRQVTLLEEQERRGHLARQDWEQAKAGANVWLRLHDLIGVNQGQRFKEFAQSLNLDRLIHKANIHLERLSPRYRLAQVCRDSHPTLEFSVLDLWQVSSERATRGLTGRERSPRTLSGGERFLFRWPWPWVSPTCVRTRFQSRPCYLTRASAPSTATRSTRPWPRFSSSRSTAVKSASSATWQRFVSGYRPKSSSKRLEMGVHGCESVRLQQERFVALGTFIFSTT